MAASLSPFCASSDVSTIAVLRSACRRSLAISVLSARSMDLSPSMLRTCVRLRLQCWSTKLAASRSSMAAATWRTVQFSLSSADRSAPASTRRRSGANWLSNTQRMTGGSPPARTRWPPGCRSRRSTASHLLHVSVHDGLLHEHGRRELDRRNFVSSCRRAGSLCAGKWSRRWGG